MAESDPKIERPPEPEAGASSALQMRLTLSEMLDVPSFTDLCRGFSDLYRIGIKVYEEHGPKLVDIKAGGAELCGYLFEFSNGQALCMRTAARVKDGALDVRDGARLAPEGPSGTLMVPCFSGCRYLVMPIRHEGDVLGRVVFGPFLPDDLRDLPPTLSTVVGQGFDVSRARQLMQAMRRAPESAVARILAHFGSILDSLIFAGQKVYLTGQVHIEATREAFREIEAKNRELTATNEKLRELDRLKSNFLATISHELRTPLTSIIGYSEMLSQGMAGSLNGEQDEYVRTILEKGESLLALIGSILDVTKIEAGRVHLVLAPCDINEVARQAITTVLPQAQRKGLHLETRLAPGMPRPSVDRDKIRQTLINLLANSVKFTPNGGRVRLSVVPEAAPEMLNGRAPGFALIVEDTGIGIPAEQFDRIFETFYQVDQSSTREFGGAGLGLAIVKSFVEAHAGRVKVESELNRWSRFTCALPFAPAPAVPADDGAERF